FGGGDPNLRTGVRQQRACCFARNHGADHIADGERLRTLLLGLALRREGVGCFAGLRDDDGQGVGRDDGIAVAEFATVIDFHGKARKPFDDVLPGQPGVPARAAGDNFDLFEAAKIGFGDIDLVQEDAAAFETHTAEHGVFDGARLLKDLFEHEMLVAALFGHNGVPQNMRDLAAHRAAVEIGQMHAFGSDDRDIAVVQKDHVARVAENRRNVGSDKEFIVSETDYNRWPGASGDNLVRIGARNHADGKYARDLFQRRADGVFEPAVQVLFD